MTKTQRTARSWLWWLCWAPWPDNWCNFHRCTSLL